MTSFESRDRLPRRWLLHLLNGIRYDQVVKCPNISRDNGVFPKCFHGIPWQKIFVIKRTRTCHLLCKRPGCYHSTSKTHVRDRIFKLSPIHAWVVYQIPWIPFRKTPIFTPTFLLNIGSVVLKQTQVYVSTLVEFILVNVVTLLYKLELNIWIGNYTGLYTNIWIDWIEYEMARELLLDVIQLIIHENRWQLLLAGMCI